MTPWAASRGVGTVVFAMRRLALALTVAIWALLSVGAFAQTPKVSWRGELVPADTRVGETAQLVLTATIEKNWHVYSMEKHTDGPVATAFEVVPNPALEVVGDPIQPEYRKAFDPGFEIEVGYHEGEVSFGIPVKVLSSGTATVEVLAVSQACDASTCDPPTRQSVSIAFNVASGEARPDRFQPVTTVPQQPAGWVKPVSEPKDAPADDKPADAFSDQLGAARSQGLAAYLWLSFGFGLLALLTPCVFPMIPITVSYFSKRAETSPKAGISGALAYCAGIIGTFTALGLIVTLLFGASGIQRLATNPYINLALAVLFVVLAANLFGVFEIQMPSWLVNKAGAGSRGNGLLAPVLMGLTFTLTSFTCTVPFVGTLLVGAAQGDVLYPALGMLAFSTAFAIPFFLLAVFPQYLAKLPKSGSWMTSVKVTMGFLELAAALKFLSNADLVWKLGLLTQPVFLAIWAGIAAVASMYLLGWFYLPHETPGKPGILRRGIGVLMAVAAYFCLAGIQGRSLGELSAFLPPDPYPGQKSSAVGAIPWVHTYDEALAAAKSQGKPLFVNFTGVTCTNCRWMEKNMFPRPAVSGEIGSYIPVELYTDRGTPEDLANRELQQKLTGVITLPVYVLVSPEGKALKVFQGSTRDESEFVAFLKSRTEVAAMTAAQPATQP